jgi:DNA-binding response OmpR family regulator
MTFHPPRASWSLRILVAEDDPVTRRILETTPSRIGFEIITPSDGGAAWRVLETLTWRGLETLNGRNAPELSVLKWVPSSSISTCRADLARHRERRS